MQSNLIPWNFNDDEGDVPDDSPAFSDQSIPAANVGSPAQTKNPVAFQPRKETAH